MLEDKYNPQWDLVLHKICEIRYFTLVWAVETAVEKGHKEIFVTFK